MSEFRSSDERIEALEKQVANLGEMQNREKHFQVSLSEFILRQAAWQTMFSRMVLKRLQNLESAPRLRAQTARLPDSIERSSLLERISDLEASTDSTVVMSDLTDALFRQESDHEKIEAKLTALKASIPSPNS